MIFELDHRSPSHATVATAHFSAAASRVFGILSDPTSWGLERLPRVASAIAPEKVVLSFDGIERATVNVSPWRMDFCQAEIILDGFADSKSQFELENFWQSVLEMLTNRLGQPKTVVASSPGKVNIYFAVGAFQKDGFHEVASCYQGLALREKVSVELTGQFSIDFAGPFAKLSEEAVPRDSSNLIYKAAVSLSEISPSVKPDQIAFTIHKSVPIAGGMAGGSADAAASLLAVNELFDVGLEGQLGDVAAKLGSDVPFSLTGGTAIGTGRGEILSRVETAAVLHWVMTPSDIGLSTPEVYRKLDLMRVGAGVDVSKLESPEVPRELIDALVSADAKAVAGYMHNDLEIAALAIRPELAEIIDQGKKAGALRSMVSGSGPTVAHLAKDRIHAEQIVARLALAGFPSIATHTSTTGTRLEN